MMQSGLPSYTVPPSTAKSAVRPPFGARPESADNPAATQPFAAGSSRTHQGGSPTGYPFGARSESFDEAPATQPFTPGDRRQEPATQPFGAASGHPYGHGSQSTSSEDARHPYRDSSERPYGVGGAAATPGPFGGFSSPSAQRTASQDQYGSPVPQQRPDAPGFGNDGYPSPDATIPVPTGFPQADPTMPVYNYGSIDSTMPVSTNPVENSGSLTGHILAQGWRDESSDRRRSNVKVAIAMLVVLGLLVTVSLVFLFTAGDAFTNMIKGVFK